MELIPILSTIILVATISTFILAIGAYILYKVRERKGETIQARKPAAMQGELLTPLEELKYSFEKNRNNFDKEYVEKIVSEKIKEIPKRKEIIQRGKPGPLHKQRMNIEVNKTESELRIRQDEKFLKYTTEGYVPPIEDENVSKIRWR